MMKVKLVSQSEGGKRGNCSNIIFLASIYNIHRQPIFEHLRALSYLQSSLVSNKQWSYFKDE